MRPVWQGLLVILVPCALTRGAVRFYKSWYRPLAPDPQIVALRKPIDPAAPGAAVPYTATPPRAERLALLQFADATRGLAVMT